MRGTGRDVGERCSVRMEQRGGMRGKTDREYKWKDMYMHLGSQETEQQMMRMSHAA